MEEKKKKSIISTVIIVAICLSIPVLLIAPIFVKARNLVRHVICTSNQKQITTAASMWMQENNEKMPGTDFWEVIIIDKKVLKCHDDKNYKKNGNSYVYNRAVAGQDLERITDPVNTVLTADGEHAATYNTKANIAYSVRDLRFRHSDRIICSYVDGHATMSRKGIDSIIEDQRPGTRIVFKVLKDSFGNLNNYDKLIGQDGWNGERIDFASSGGKAIAIDTRYINDGTANASKSGIFDSKYSKVMAKFDWIPVEHRYIEGSITMNVSICGPLADSAVNIKLSTENNTLELITERETFTKKIKRTTEKSYHFSIIIDSETKTGTITVTDRGKVIWQVEGFALNKTAEKNKIIIDAAGNSRTLLANLQFGIPVIMTFTE